MLKHHKGKVAESVKLGKILQIFYAEHLLLWRLFMVRTQGCLEGPGSSPKCGQLQSAIWHIFQELTPRGRCPGASCPAAYAGCHTAKALQPWIMKIYKGHLLKLWLFSHCEPGFTGISATFSVGWTHKVRSADPNPDPFKWRYLETFECPWFQIAHHNFQGLDTWRRKWPPPQSSRRLHEEVRNRS